MYGLIRIARAFHKCSERLLCLTHWTPRVAGGHFIVDYDLLNYQSDTADTGNPR